MRYISARQMIFDAYHEQRGSVMAYAQEIARMGAQVQTTQRNNNDWRIVNGLEAGAVISAVERQPQHLQALARYCFGPFTKNELAGDREIVEIALYQQMIHDGVKLPGQGKGKPTAQQLETLRYLCMAALYHHSETTWPYLRKGLKNPRDLKEWMYDSFGIELDIRRWSSISHGAQWSKSWKQALDCLDSWEAEGLIPVASLIKSKAA
ncbi:hypothetical protein [Halomonas campaniensis]|uniref:Uncharacterized protein n=1 Tax=Halomonas campaniensis TaxID=213554 RepID=A0A246RVB4_9GAMM|nr:hypothetical protein [Halomonas campaniensis]OWV28102.1 hypothetical protein JI62_17300 [Halomonas campaniensis]